MKNRKVEEQDRSLVSLEENAPKTASDEKKRVTKTVRVYYTTINTELL